MSEAAEGPPVEPRKVPFSDARSWALAVPVVFGGGMILAAVAWWLAVSNTAGSASGATVHVSLDSTCANTEIAARLADYGLPGTFAGPDLTLTLPGMPGDDRVPAALVAPGKLLLVADGKELPFVVQNGGVQINVTGTAVSLFTLQAGLPSSGITATMDGSAVEVESVNGNELMIAARGKDSTEALRFATDRVVQVRHPLPCAPKVLGVK